MSDHEQFILKKLAGCHPSSGYVTADFAFLIGRERGYETNRQHSARVLGILREMESKGLIKRADNEKPVLWQIVRLTQGDSRHE